LSFRLDCRYQLGFLALNKLLDRSEYLFLPFGNRGNWQYRIAVIKRC
jgi:hypothetical protein